MRQVLLWLSLIGFLLALPPAGAQESPPLRDQRFGVVEAFWSPEKAEELGVGWERILFYWDEIQPESSEDWNTLHVLEEWLHEGDAAGRQIMGLLIHTPEWAAENPEHGLASLPSGLYLPVDDPDNLWAGYVRRIAEYYGQRGVHHWTIWNEPDITPDAYGHEFSGSVEDYYQLVKVAYTVMKEVDPEAQIHLAGVTYWHDAVAGREQYLQRLFQVITADPAAPANDYFFDIISLHIYFRTETVSQIVREMDSIQREFGLDKPIWINETNAAPSSDPLWPVDRPDFAVDLEQQAWFIVQAHALGFSAGAESIGVYKFSDVLVAPGAESFGLLRADLSERPAFQAHKTTIALLQDFEQVSEVVKDEYVRVVFTRPGSTVTILWAKNETAVTVSIPPQGINPNLFSAIGEPLPLDTANDTYQITLEGARCYDECIIGGPPVFLVETNPWIDDIGLQTLPPPSPPATSDQPPATTSQPLAASRQPLATNTPEIIVVEANTTTPLPPTPTVVIETVNVPTESRPVGLYLIGMALLMIPIIAIIWKNTGQRKN